MALVVIVSTSSMSLTACGYNDDADGSNRGYDQIADYKPTSRDQIKDGGHLNLAIDELTTQENPFHGDGTAYTTTIWSYYNPQLAMYTPRGEFSPNHDYVTDIKEDTSSGKTVLTYTINPRAVYNDGTPIDWRAFENTWKANNGTDEDYIPSSTDGYKLIESVTPGENDKQAVVTFSQVYPWWKGLFNILLPPQVSDAKKFNNAYKSALHPEWGAGPYTVDHVNFKKGEVVFKRNDKWWGDKGKLDSITFRQMEPQASINALRAGEIDATSVGSRERLKTAEKMGKLVDIRTGAAPFTSLITLNAKSDILSDINVRKAVMTGIDRSQLATTRFNGMGYSEKLPGSFQLFSRQKGYDDNFGAVVKFNKDEAQQILEQDGWKPGSDGVRRKDGKKLQLKYVLLGDDSLSRATAQATQKMMSDIGVQLSIQERPSSEFSDVVTRRDFDMFPMGFSQSDPYGVAYFQQTYASDSQLNRSGTGTAEMDEKINELQKLPTEDEQIRRANELEKEAFARYGIMPVTNGPSITAANPDLVNFGPKFFGSVKLQDIGWKKK
ncbi:ABC transporter family substrate-binding protein [Corynebacterium kroppenstedtii]|nr:ABC transporter family substrate-binding protein [Corynebacterium kroppenstedtii]